MVRRARWAGVVLVGAGLGLSAPIASASNGMKPRIPVDWTNASCMTIVDRSVGATVHFDYEITQEDTELTADEVEDSRTHQFFGFCQARDPQSFLPRWITDADVARAAMVGAGPDEADPEDVLESASTWSSCFERINADDARVPITFAAAAAGVDWNTAQIPAGTYVVEGYTWEPAINIWSLRPGVVKVVDDPDPALSAPALAVTNSEEVINKNASVLIEGCVSAMPGSTLTAWWSRTATQADWQPFAEDVPVNGDSFSVEFVPPEALVGESGMIRVDVTDPMGRSYTNYMRELVIVLGTDGPGCADGGGFIGGPGCEDGDSGDASGEGGDATSGPGTGGSGGSGGGPNTSAGGSGDDAGGPGGCACSTGRSGAPLSGLLMVLGLWGLRRRR